MWRWKIWTKLPLPIIISLMHWKSFDNDECCGGCDFDDDVFYDLSPRGEIVLCGGGRFGPNCLSLSKSLHWKPFDNDESCGGCGFDDVFF